MRADKYMVSLPNGNPSQIELEPSVETMRRSKLHSRAYALIFVVLIVLSSILTVNLQFETVGAESTGGEEEPTRGEGNIWYVDDDAAEGGNGSLEKPYQKIQDAVDNASEGDTIRVWNGTYEENIVVDKSVSLVGNGSETTTIEGSGRDDVVRITADWVKIRCFTITESGMGNKGVKIESNNITIQNSTCSNNDDSIYLYYSNDCIIENNTSSNNGRGIRVYNSINCTITNNTCLNNDEGIFIYGSSDCTIANNTCSSNNKYGINLRYPSNITIENNICHSNHLYGIRLRDSNNSTIVNNTCTASNNNGISLRYSSNDTLENNICSNNDYGITLAYSYNGSITNNTCSANNNYGIYLVPSNDCLLENNTCTANKNYGIRLSESSNCTLQTNTVSENRWGIVLTHSSRYNIVHNNYIFNNTEFGINATDNNGFFINASHNWWGFISGPFHPINNSDGKGDNVTDYVQFDPWIGKVNTWYVAKYGNDETGNGTLEGPFLTIQKAMAESNDGDIIRVFEGVYEENVVVNKSVDIIGNGSGETVIHGVGNGLIETVNISKYNTTDKTMGIDIVGNYAYVADWNNGLVILDISNGKEPIKVGSCLTTDKAWKVAVQGDYAYVADRDTGLVIVNISDKENPRLVGEHETTGHAFDVTVSGEYAYIADYGSGLIIFNISDPEDPIKIGEYDTDANAHSADIIGDLAYVADGHGGLVILDIANRSSPKLISIYDISDGFQTVSVVGNYAYLGEGSYPGGLVIVDISDNENPRLLSDAESPSATWGMELFGDYAYLAQGNSLYIFDISDINAPQNVLRYKTPGQARDVTVSRDNVYIADDANGLIIIDTIVSGYSIEINADNVGLSGVTVRNSSLAGVLIDANNVDMNSCIITGNNDGIRIVNDSGNVIINECDIFENNGYGINASDNNGKSITSINNWWGDPSGPFHPSENPKGKGNAVSDNVDFDPWLLYPSGYTPVTLHVAKSGNDITGNGSFSAPFLTIQTALEASNHGDNIRVFDGVYEENVVVEKNVEIIGNGSGETVIQGVGGPRVELIQKGLMDVRGSARGVVVIENYAYVIDGNDLIVIDITNPSDPSEEAKYDTDNSYDLAVTGDYAYIADGNYGLAVIDISDPSDPAEEGHYNTEGFARGVAVSNDYAYVADQRNGLVIVNVSDPKNPAEIGQYDTGGWAYGVAVRGDYVYVADGSNGLVVVDISDPINPTKEDGYDTAGDAFDVAVNGDYAYIADKENGLVVVDISDPSDLRKVARYDTPDYVYYVTVSGENAYVAAGDDGLVVVDISDPSDPTEKGGYDTEGNARTVALAGDYGYIADGSNGLVIGEMYFPPEAVLHISSDNARLSDLTIHNGSVVGVLVDANRVIIENCEISENAKGIRLINGSSEVKVHHCDIYENSNYGIDAFDNKATSMNATNNWWGHPSGPFHPTLNPGGKGNAVSDNVEFEPWLIRPNDFRIHHVAPGGNDTAGNGDKESPYRTIQKAIDMAQDWDTIIVAPGTYTESITIDKRNITITGDSSDTTIIEAGGVATTCTITADDVELIGFTIRNGIDNGILIVNSSGVSIINCTFPENSYDINLMNSKNVVLINTTFETVNYNDPLSGHSVFWPLNIKVTDNRSGFIPDAHLKLTDAFGTTIFDGFTDSQGIIPQMMLLVFSQVNFSMVDYNPHTITVRKNGYLNFSKDITIDSYALITCELQAHILPQAIISGELIQYTDMDSPITLDGSESTGRSITFHWDFGFWGTSSAPSPTHCYTLPGVYQVNLTVTDDYDNSSSTSIAVIVENVDPVAIAEADKETAFEDEAIQFDASASWDTSSDFLYYHWDFGDGTGTGLMAPVHVYMNQGEYVVSLTVTDRFGRTNTTTLDISIVNKAPWNVASEFAGTPYIERSNRFTGTATDTMTDIAGLQYSWNFGDGTNAFGKRVYHSYRSAGNYLVNLSVTDDNGASTHALLNISIAEPYINVTVSASHILQDESVHFIAVHEFGFGKTYTWYFGDGTNGSGQEISHAYTSSGVFSPVLLIFNGQKNITIILQDIIVENQKPVAIIYPPGYTFNEGEIATFDAEETIDSPSDKPILSYLWDFGDGSTGVGKKVTHMYHDSGLFPVRLIVSDGKDSSTIIEEFEVLNAHPTADAGYEKRRKAVIGTPVILDASNSIDTSSDVSDLNYTWLIGNDTVYGKVVSYPFEKTGEFIVTLTVRDDDGATSEDTLTFIVTKYSESDDGESMNTMSWILLVIILVFLVVIGFLLHARRDEALYREMKALDTADEAIVVEGEIDTESFKPKASVHESPIEIEGGQKGGEAGAAAEVNNVDEAIIGNADDGNVAIVEEGIVEAVDDAEEEVEIVGDEGNGDDLFKPPADNQEDTTT